MNLLEVIPSEWIKASVGKYCDVQLGKMLQNDPASERDELKRYVRAINVAKSGLDLSHDFSMWIKPQEVERFRLRRGDILVSEGGDAGRTAVFDSDDEYYFQNAINRVRPIGDVLILPEFIYYWFTFLKVAGYVEMVCNVATIAHFTAEKVKAAPLALPPLETQRRIARFLDEKTARIDGLIQKKRALLDRLAEKRQALITRAVTKGLTNLPGANLNAATGDGPKGEGMDSPSSPAAPMKPSGIDWLGDIPAHWEVKRLRHVVRLLSGSTPTTTVTEYWDGDIPWISPKDMKSDALSGSIDKVTALAVEEYGLREFREPNAVLVIRGMILARRIPVAVASGVYTINQDMKVMESKGWLSPEFLQMYMASIESYLMTLVGEAGHGTKALRTDVLLDTPILIPPSAEQAAIVAQVESQKIALDQTTRKIEALADRLTEYRAALITAAVTGKLDLEVT
ncbi:MAG: restriction endonuclease subunit S [Porticoccaceae bacterium]